MVAAAHSHRVHGKAFSTLHHPLLPVTQYACMFFYDHAVDREYGGATNDVTKGKRIAAALGHNKRAILAIMGS
jgi:ribulose-5-phosphate 4-epimerase/fuculose-1-phosphate aldolase